MAQPLNPQNPLDTKTHYDIHIYIPVVNVINIQSFQEIQESSTK